MSAKPAENRSVFGVMLCSDRSMAMRMSSSQRSISDTQLHRNRGKKGKATQTMRLILFHQWHCTQTNGPTVLPSFMCTSVRSAGTWRPPPQTGAAHRCPWEWTNGGPPTPPHFLWSAKSHACYHETNICRQPVPTPTGCSHTVMPNRGNWPWTLNWLDGVTPRLVYIKESLN